MRIERIKVEAFGRLRRWDSGPDGLPGLVAVLGPNEAGKSTLFHCLTTLLYGFRPASRESNPYAPWSGPDAEAAALIRLDGSACVEVERRLLSQPTGRMTVDGRGEELRNRALPWTEHVPVQVFRQVFALTLSDLAGLDGETWGRVQDRIVGSMGASDLAPAREVAADLEREAGELWRPNRRGNQRIRDIQQEIRGLRGLRREALERDGSLRAMVAERDQTREELQAAREARQRERLAVDRVQDLLPVRRQLQRIDALREEAGPPEALRGLPEDPEGRLEALERGRSESLRRRHEIEGETIEPAGLVAAFGEREADIVAHADQVAGFVARAEGLAVERARAHGLEREIEDLNRRIQEDAAELLSLPSSDTDADRLAALSTSELRARVYAFAAADEELRILVEAERRGAESVGRDVASRAWVAGAAVAAIGGAVLVWALRTGDPLTAVAGGLVVVVGLVLLVSLGRARRRSGHAEAAERVRSAGQGRDRARARVLDLLGEIPLAAELIEEPSLRLVAGIERLQDALRDRAERLRTLNDVRARLAGLDAEARSLSSALHIASDLDALGAARLMEREVRTAERSRDAAAGAGRQLTRLEREGKRLDDEIAKLDAEARILRDRLGDLGEGDPERGARVAADRLRAEERAKQLRDELERAHPSLDEVAARITEAERAGESWTMDDEDLVRRRARIEELGEDVERLAARAEALDRDIAHARDLETTDAVDGEIAALQEEEARLTFERDRDWVLAQLVREADRRFREEHQPDLMRRASEYLAHLTGGRYDRIAADETAQGDLFHIYGPALPAPVPLTPPISTGTLEQAYLSLRLAIVDHLDQGGERLPLFVDEVLVNWDQERRARGMDVLVDVSARRQLFVFTCHDDVAADLAAHGARVLRLGDR